ncbi:MAG: response regulator transcription factor [Anaerolineaceae bacterium]|nr:response regulator transcription factor [Anaerolineaceae bacterium]
MTNTILLIEDEIKLAEIIQKELKKDGFHVVLSSDGNKALSYFHQINPDLVILDWMLPGMSGLDILRSLREFSSIPIMMLTARTEFIDRVVGLEVGADDYLTKPFNMAELIARIRALLRQEKRIRDDINRDQQPKQNPIHYENLMLDPENRICSLENEVIELTSLEFDLLFLFLSFPGRTFNRKYLIETIWKSEYIEGERSVDNAILRLRRKLQSAGDFLETIRGVGYRIKRINIGNSSKTEWK